MFVPLHLLAAVLVLHLASQLPGGDAAFSGSMRCPCASSLGASWELSLDQAVRVSDVVMMGRVLELRDGLGGMMNASLSSMITYKGRFSQGGGFLTRVDHVTNFEKGAPREMALFFFATEPAGNLALQCMAPLTALNSVGDLKAVLDFVRDFGRQLEANKENEILVPSPCTTNPSPCAPIGSYCTVTNTLPGHTYKCTCLTGYVGDGHVCELLEGPTPEPTPVHPLCGGVSFPLLDILGNTERCNEGDILKLECPPMHYCHHGVCCPVTPPTTVAPMSSPSPSPSSSPSSPSSSSSSSSSSTTPTPTPVAPPPDTDDCGSGGSGGGESSGSGHCGDRGSGYGSGGSGERGMNSEEYTFEDDEDMAYGQGKKMR